MQIETAVNESSGKLLTAHEVADVLGMKPGWVYERSRSGEIPTVKLGRYFRYRADKVNEWIVLQESRRH